VQIEGIGRFGYWGEFWRLVVRHEALFDREGMKGPLLRVVAAVR
jgi:hypothetical protein